MGVTDSNVEAGGLVKHAFVVGEGVEAGLAVIGPHAAAAYSAKGEIGSRQVENGVVDATAAKGYGF